ncbi:hypothetical protein Cni_G02353 [Canna indica]|uniref:MULE transposase domain-containing protein n=1 Tax=Canna indica TaxID=4628 RepID=A0AAQ3Q021_9LILI|nr:hypothetical protein Cni_G02353 [Canna indica]
MKLFSSKKESSMRDNNNKVWKKKKKQEVLMRILPLLILVKMSVQGARERRREFTSIIKNIRSVHDYTIIGGFNIKWRMSGKDRCVTVCIEGCKWTIKASMTRKNEALNVKEYTKEHTCTRPSRNRQASYQWLARHYLERFRQNTNWGVLDMLLDLDKDYDIRVSSDTCYKERKQAQKIILGTLEEQYNLVPSYMVELKRINMNSFFDLQVERGPNLEAIFKRFYVGFEALRSGFLRGCRLVISLDGCFLKTQIGGQLLSDIGRDGNNQMFSIAWAVVEGENQDSWTWFLERLALDLRITNGFEMTVISDQQKRVVKSTTEADFRGALDEMRAMSPEAVEAFTQIEVQKFCRGDTNYMQRIALKREKILSWTDELCPRIKKKLEKNKLDSRGFTSTPGRPKKVRKKDKSEKDPNPKKGGTKKRGKPRKDTIIPPQKINSTELDKPVSQGNEATAERSKIPIRKWNAASAPPTQAPSAPPTQAPSHQSQGTFSASPRKKGAIIKKKVPYEQLVHKERAKATQGYEALTNTETVNVYVRMPGEQLRTTYIGAHGAQFTTVINQHQSQSTSIADKPDQHQQEAANLGTQQSSTNTNKGK